MRKYNVLLTQFNNQYGGQIYVPYSVGLLKAYACQNENVLHRFNFLPFVVERNDVSNIIDKDIVVDVLGISCYMWNWQISLDFAKHIRENNPECLIILGGPQVPNKVPKDFFTKNPFVDMLCHSEGEQTFEEILLKFKTNDKNIGGISYFDNENDYVRTTSARLPIKDLNIIPSPYLTGDFDYLFDDPKHNYMPIWETNRGCPFKCTFCDWGFVASKVRKFNGDRLIKEIDYFSEKKTRLIFGADANFGIFKRDLDLAKSLSEKKKETGYPKEFRVCFTKNSTHMVFELAKIFADAGMNKGVSISMQSLNETVLENIKRKNIKMSFFKELQEKYIKEGLKTYTELVLPLPGETYESFIDSIDRLLASSQHSGIVVYNCSIMPNAEMGQESYQKKYGIDIAEVPVFLSHSNKNDDVMEKEFIAVGTESMPRSEWKKAFKFSWIVQSMHLLGTLQVVSVVLYNLYGIKYKDFYQKLLESDSSVINNELSMIDNLLNGVLVGKGFDQYLDNFEHISWPPEEATFLRILEHLDDFYEEVYKFILGQYPYIDCDILTELILYQKSVLKNYWDVEDKNISFNYDLKTYFEDCRVGNMSDLNHIPVTYTYKDTKYYHNDKKMFSKEVVWFGRKGGGFFKEVI